MNDTEPQEKNNNGKERAKADEYQYREASQHTRIPPEMSEPLHWNNKRPERAKCREITF